MIEHKSTADPKDRILGILSYEELFGKLCYQSIVIRCKSFKKEIIREERPLTSLAGKRRYTKLFSPKLLDNSRLLIRIIGGMRSSTLLANLRSIY